MHAPRPTYPTSTLLPDGTFDKFRCNCGDGDMRSLTSADDDHVDDDWGTYGDYQPNFPTKWMSADGKTLLMASSGSFDDYNLTLQKITLTVVDHESHS